MRTGFFDPLAALLRRSARLCWIAALSLPLVVAAADTAPAARPADDVLKTARAQIQAKQWPDALAELRRVNATASADWQSLMGYMVRKGSTPDLDASERFYLAALTIDPRHRGALEYSGELYLMKGDLPRAEQQMATLDKACFFGCEELDDLKKAVARYKLAGKWVAEP